MASPFDSEWPLAAPVIAHVAASLQRARGNATVQEACLELQKHLLDGTVKTRGPLGNPEAMEIYTEFWRHAVPSPDGSAYNRYHKFKLRWFEIRAREILRIWPSAAPSAEPRPPVQPEDVKLNPTAAAPHLSTAKPAARPRGRRPQQLDRVIKEMRASDQFSRLSEMTEHEMETVFKASRDTCRRARNKIL
jgi:hypothetical protein